MESTLVLNASFEPLGITPATKAINKILNGKAVSVDDSPKLFRAAETELAIPYVVQMTYMINRKVRSRIGFSRRGVLARDGFSCAYCGKKADTIDHVIPRAFGGQNTWENCVAACGKCNNKKSDSTLEQMGWSLDFVPHAPSPYVMLLNKTKPGSPEWASWNEFVEPWSKVMV